MTDRSFPNLSYSVSAFTEAKQVAIFRIFLKSALSSLRLLAHKALSLSPRLDFCVRWKGHSRHYPTVCVKSNYTPSWEECCCMGSWFSDWKNLTIAVLALVVLTLGGILT
jgi:hypothetical protein